MKETDGLPGVAVQKCLGGSGHVNYYLRKISAALMVVSGHLMGTLLLAKEKERRFRNRYFGS